MTPVVRFPCPSARLAPDASTPACSASDRARGPSLRRSCPHRRGRGTRRGKGEDDGQQGRPRHRRLVRHRRSHCPETARTRLHHLRRGPASRTHGSPHRRGHPHPGDGCHRRGIHAGRNQAHPRRTRPDRRPGQRRRLRLLRRHRGRAAGRGPAPVRGQRLRRARLTQLVLPAMRDQRAGTIINITSMGGKIYTPARRLVPRHQVRPRSPQRLPAPGGRTVRHPASRAR